jgi:hypothetical protein
MSDRFAMYWCKVNHHDRVTQHIEVVLRSIGPQLEYPGTHAIKLLSNTGEQLDVSLAEFFDRLDNTANTSFQLWWTGDEDLYCRVRFLSSLVIFDFGLDGQNDYREHLLLGNLQKLSNVTANSGRSCGFVFDPNGSTIEYGWDDIILAKSPPPAGLPKDVVAQFYKHDM